MLCHSRLENRRHKPIVCPTSLHIDLQRPSAEHSVDNSLDALAGAYLAVKRDWIDDPHAGNAESHVFIRLSAHLRGHVVRRQDLNA
jgi:hypothetical protein